MFGTTIVKAVKRLSRFLSFSAKPFMFFADGNYPCPECCIDCVYYSATTFIPEDWDVVAGTWGQPDITGESGEAYIIAAPQASFTKIEVTNAKPYDPDELVTPEYNPGDAFTLVINNGGTEYTATFKIGDKGIEGDSVTMEGETKSSTIYCDSRKTGFIKACLSLLPDGTLIALMTPGSGRTVCIKKQVGTNVNSGRPGIKIHQATTFKSVTYQNLDVGGGCKECGVCPDDTPQSACCCAFKNTDPAVDPVPETVTANISGYSKFTPNVSEMDLENQCNCDVTIGSGCNECANINGMYELTFDGEYHYDSNCIVIENPGTGCRWSVDLGPVCASGLDCHPSNQSGLRQHIAVNIYGDAFGCHVSGYIQGCSGATRNLEPIPDDELGRCDIDGSVKSYNPRCDAECGLGDCGSCCYLMQYGNAVGSDQDPLCNNIIFLAYSMPLCEAGFVTEPGCDPNGCFINLNGHCCACCHTADMTLNFNLPA